MNHHLENNKYRQRNFYTVGFLGLLFLFSVRFIGLPFIAQDEIPHLASIFGAAIDILISSLIASLSIVIFLAWTSSPLVGQAKLRVIDPRDLQDELKDFATDTEKFVYKGQAGKWTRTVTLPQIGRQIDKDQKTREVLLIVADPSNRKALETYASLGRKVSGAKSSTVEEVRNEICATVLSAFMCQCERPQLKVRIAVSGIISHMRVDMYSAGVVLTTAGKDDPAIFYPAGSHFYDVMKEELLIAEQQSRSVQCSYRRKPGEQGIMQMAREVLSSVTLDGDLLCEVLHLTDDDRHAIFAKIEKPKRPYK